MTGPEHYRAAETCREAARDLLMEDEPKSAELQLRFAQVHATLALTAATAMNDNAGGMGPYDFDAWRETVSAGWKPLPEVTS